MAAQEAVSELLEGGYRPEIIFLFAEVGWSYGCLKEHKQTLLDGGLRWIQAASSGAEKLCPIWVGSEVVCTNGAGIYASTLAEFCLGAILHFVKHFPRLHSQKERRVWQMRDDDSVPPDDVEGKTVLIAGYGATGAATARLAQAFGMRTVGVKRQPKPEDFDFADELISPTPKPALLEALGQADYVVCALPKTEETHHFFGAPEFAAMKSSAIFVNVGRGDNCDEQALAAALRSGELRGAALDVFEEEPLPTDSELWALENLLLSPHATDMTVNYPTKSAKLFAANLQRYRESGLTDLANTVDLVRGY